MVPTSNRKTRWPIRVPASSPSRHRLTRIRSVVPIGTRVGGRRLTATAEISAVGAAIVQFTGPARVRLDDSEVEVDAGDRLPLA